MEFVNRFLENNFILWNFLLTYLNNRVRITKRGDIMFGDFINQRRKSLGMSIDELVEKSQIPKGTVSKITSGISTNPTLNTMEALCSALGCSISDAIGYSEEVNPFELVLLEKYRALDEHGKKILDFILDAEYNRCTNSENNKKLKVKTVAAVGGLEQVIVKDEEKLNAAIDEAFKKQNNN